MNTKTLISAVFVGIKVVIASRAQSSFHLDNQFVNAPVFDAQGAPLAGTNYLAELWGAATFGSLTPALTFGSRQRIIVPFQSGELAGYFIDPGGRTFGDELTVLSVQTGDLAWLEVRAWDSRFGGTYEQVAALGVGGYGESPLFSARGTYPLDLLGVPAPLIGLQSFSLLPVVPEPSSLFLGLLGLPLLFSRRLFRKRMRLLRDSTNGCQC